MQLSGRTRQTTIHPSKEENLQHKWKWMLLLFIFMKMYIWGILYNGVEADILLSDLAQLPKDKMDLESPLTMAELSRAVQELNSGKSPGLDGLPAEFNKAFWKLIAQDCIMFCWKVFKERSFHLPGFNFNPLKRRPWLFEELASLLLACCVLSSKSFQKP